MLNLTSPPGFGRRALVCALGHGAAWLEDLVDLLVDGHATVPAPLPELPSRPQPMADPVDVYGCDLDAFPPMPSREQLLVAIRARQEAAARPVNPLWDSVVWEPGFAFEVQPQALLLLDGPHGRRAMRVVRLRRREVQTAYGTPLEVVTFLLVDAETGEPDRLTVDLLEALTVGALVPDVVPADFGGAA